ncbi:MAG: hypothetical protein ACTSRU_02875 [Candidatus Hodarchaeales archaeon]
MEEDSQSIAIPRDFTVLKTCFLLFGILPLFGLSFAIFEFQPVAALFEQSGYFILAYGVYSFSTGTTGSILAEGKKTALNLTIFGLVNILGLLFSVFLFPVLPENPSVTEVHYYELVSIISTSLSLLVYIFFLYIVIIFTSWFNRIAKLHSSDGTEIMKWLGIVNVITSIVSTIGSFIHTSLLVQTKLTGESPNEINIVILFTILGIAGILLIIGIGLRVVTGIILYTKSNQLENCPESFIT